MRPQESDSCGKGRYSSRKSGRGNYPTMLFVLVGLCVTLIHSEDSLVVNIARSGNDTTQCLEGGKIPCLTVDYVLRNLLSKQISSVKIVVSSNQSLPTADGYMSWVSKVVIVGKKDVIFRCKDGVSLFLNFIYTSGSIVRMKGIHFENCRTVDDGIRFIIAYVDRVVMEDCTFCNGGTVSLISTCGRCYS